MGKRGFHVVRGLRLGSGCPQVNRFKYVNVWSHGNPTSEQID